jgi:hypothetical protein
MKPITVKTLVSFILITCGTISSAQVKTSIEMTADNVGAIICEYNTKYNAAYWDNFTKTIGNNTSIIMNNLKKVFPKYHLSDFNYSQNQNEQSNKVTFKIEGMMGINKAGKWEADLDKTNPDITKVSDKEYLLVEEGAILKLHLPSGTDDAKVEKNSFNKAILTYSPSSVGGSGKIMRYAGILLALAGVFLLFKNRQRAKVQPGIRTIYQQATAPNQQITQQERNKEITNENRFTNN